jgi:hypothetical protein
VAAVLCLGRGSSWDGRIWKGENNGPKEVTRRILASGLEGKMEILDKMKSIGKAVRILCLVGAAAQIVAAQIATSDLSPRRAPGADSPTLLWF